MSVTIGDSISRVRNILKAVKEDPFMTDRFLYSLISKYGKALIKRDSKKENIYKHSSLFKEIPCLELITVDRIEACCIGINTGLTFKRSKDKLPKIVNVDNGPIIRSVTSLDYSERLVQTQPDLYTNMTHSSGFKYNTYNYFWFLDGYLYIPEVTWEAIRIQAMFEEDISSELCSISGEIDCVVEQDREFNIPEHLFADIEQLVLQEILTAGQIPSDGADDGQNILR